MNKLAGVDTWCLMTKCVGASVSDYGHGLLVKCQWM